MIEKIGHIKNPLTIIALFSGIAEISGTGVLPFISPHHQGKYVWFLMLFPVFLVSIFFVTLWMRPRVLYSPSDYANEDNFVRMMEPATVLEINNKIESEIAEVALQLPDPGPQMAFDEALPEQPQDEVTLAGSAMRKLSSQEAVMRLYREGETRALAFLAKEFPRLRQDVAFRTEGKRLIFDGASESTDSLTLFEVKVIRVATGQYVKSEAETFAKRVAMMPSSSKAVRAILVVVHKEPIPVTWSLPQRVHARNVNVEVRYIEL